MEALDREETEYELAAAILLLWILFSDMRMPSQAAYLAFMDGFDRLVRPTLARIYGRARATLAEVQGYSYPTRPVPSGEGQTIQIPGLQHRVDQYAEDLWRTFQARQASEQEKIAQGEEPPPFSESDADRISVTTTTRVHSDGEMDASKDVESRTGKRLVAVWKTEPGACPICSPLEGTIREWRIKFPNGPGGARKLPLPPRMAGISWLIVPHFYWQPFEVVPAGPDSLVNPDVSIRGGTTYGR